MLCGRATGRSTSVLLVLVLLFAGFSAIAGAATTSKTLSDSQLARELWLWRSYLLSEQERSRFDELNRGLREAEHQKGKAKDEAAKKAAADKLADAVKGFAVALEGVGKVERISLARGKMSPETLGLFEVNGDTTAFLFRIDAGGEGRRYACVTIDESRPEHSGVIRIDCAAAGVTWAVVALQRLPVNRTTLPLEFAIKGGETLKSLMDVVTLRKGRLGVTILSDDNGEPTPAMVRLVCKATGRDYMPGNAIDLSNQFDGNGHNSGHRRANLPGKLGGWWWCVPGPFDMALPPGDYEIAIRRGVEQVPVFDQVSVRTGELTEKTYRPKRWVDMRELGWYSGDDHVHCQILSDADAERLMSYIRAEDIHVANIVKMGDILRTYFEQRGFGKEYRVIAGDHIASPGQECPRTNDEIGHTLSMNITDMVRDTDKYFLYDWVADEVHAQGGLWGYAHINSGLFHVHRDMSVNIPKGKCDFVEVLQFSHLGTGLYYEFLNLGFRMTASAGSDIPWGGTLGEVRVFAQIGDRSFSADAWFDAVRAGRTFVTNGPMLEFTVDDAIPGDAIIVDSKRKLRVRARAWGHPERAVVRNLQIVSLGEVIKQTKKVDADTGELKLDFEVDADNGFWIAAKVVADGNLSAHTTPVYVIRQGLRFWKFSAVEELIAQRMESLNQIAQLVADAQKKMQAGDLAGDKTLSELAIQGPELLKRVEEAMQIYEDLKRVAKREQIVRDAH